MILDSKDKILKIIDYSKTSKPYNDDVVNFISDLSSNLRKNSEAKNYNDIMHFAFWCRKSNIINKKLNFQKMFKNRLGLGTIFHIPPSNIPINFAYSFIFGLITGNRNIVRVSKKSSPQSDIVINQVIKLAKKKYKSILKENFFLKYEYDDEINSKFSKISDCRMIWGGDKTISLFKKYITKVNCRDLNFFDRYSISIINSGKITKLSNRQLYEVASQFYNDTYLVDQAACSSPNLILWTEKNSKEASRIFWKSLLEVINNKKYIISEFAAIDKDVFASKVLIKLHNSIEKYRSYENKINVITLKNIPSNIDQYKGMWGCFFEGKIKKFSDIKSFVNKKYQTITYYGIKSDDVHSEIIKNSIEGVDRIVPFGNSLNIDMIWDGMDLNNMLTRIVHKV